MKRLTILFICIIVLTACSTSNSVKNTMEETDQKQEIVNEVKKEDKKISKNVNQWCGEWIGANSSYFAGSELCIKALTDNQIGFELSAFNGCHTGSYNGTVTINNGKAIHKTEDDIEFIFSIDEKSKINLESNDYTYYCEHGVKFDTVYVKEINIQKPTAIEVGLVDTDEQEKILEDLTGDMYDTFIDYAQYYLDEDKNYKDYRIRTFGLLGYSNVEVVMLDSESNRIIAVIDSGSGVCYYTNDKDYQNEPPEFIKEWLGGRKIVNIKSNTSKEKNNETV